MVNKSGSIFSDKGGGRGGGRRIFTRTRVIVDGIDSQVSLSKAKKEAMSSRPYNLYYPDQENLT